MSRRFVESCERPNRVVVQRRIDTTVSLYVITSTDQGTHTTSTDKGRFEILEPESVAATMLVVRLAQRVERINDLLVSPVPFPVDEKDENLEEQLPCRDVGSV